jgi:colanic acid/amylovoran biosynthesis protein
MIDKTEKDQSDAYVPFMSDCVQYLLHNGAKPFILIHEGPDDLVLAKKIQSRVGSPIPIVQEGNALKIKGILGACDGTIGSRFHGLVSALSQGVPSLATGWSHKYEMLFRDYGFSDGLVDIRSKQQDIRAKIDLLLDKNSSDQIHLKLLQKSEELKMRSREMWSEVFKVITN